MIDKDKKRFWDKVDKTGGCWWWVAAKNIQGYGRFRHSNTHLMAHRVSYELLKEKIPDGLLVCHTCDNPSCVNPDHLFIGTYKDNADDMVKKGRSLKGDKNPSRVNPQNVRRGGTNYGTRKLCPNQVIEIIKAAKNGVFHKDLAEAYNVKRGAITAIVNRKNWKWLNVE